MAIYSTLFLCKPEELPSAFLGWRLPLPQRVRREFKNPFTGNVSAIETREPEWPDEPDDLFERKYQVVAVEGRFEDYLEGRLPPFVRAHGHWATKGLTQIELSPLAQILGVESNFDHPLFAPPSSGATLFEIPPEMLLQLAPLDERGLVTLAEKWAATMSVAGEPLEILGPIVVLARQAGDSERMYLLIEA